MRPRLTIVIITTLFAVAFAYESSTAVVFPRALDNESFHCNVDSANDLHIRYWADTKMWIMAHTDDRFPNFSATAFDAGWGDSSGWDCKWSGEWVHYCEAVHVGVAFWQVATNELHKDSVYWTIDSQKVGDFLPGPGFSVQPWSGPDPTVYSITNSTSVPFEITNLQFRFSAQETPLDSMMYGLLDFGPDTVHNPIVLDPGGSWDTTFPGQAGQYYLMAQGIVGGPTGEGNFVHQHEHLIAGVIPTLTEWGMIIFCALLFGWMAWVIVRRRKAVNVRI